MHKRAKPLIALTSTMASGSRRTSRLVMALVYMGGRRVTRKMAA